MTAQPTPQLRSFLEPLPVTLTADELVSRSAEIITVMKETDLLKAHKKAAADSYKAKIELKNERLRELRDVCESMTETREIPCVEKLVAETGAVDVIRTDTGEVVRTRAASFNERQEQLPLEVDETSIDARVVLAAEAKDMPVDDEADELPPEL